MKKRLLWIFIFVLIVCSSFSGFLLMSGPALSPYALRAVEELPEREISELVSGKVGYARSGEIDIWYEVLGNPLNPPILMVNGLGGSALSWSPHLIRGLLDEGFCLIRFDHRDLGCSEKVETWDAEKPYTLEDMAGDALAILDTLNLSKVHLLGYSMGGMIAQSLALSHSERFYTFTCISSSGFMNDPELTALSNSLKWQLLRFLLQSWVSLSPQQDIIRGLEAQTILRNFQPLTEEEVNFWMDIHRYDSTLDRREHKDVGTRHVNAILASGSRLENLPNIQLPTLIFHGTKDPLILPEHTEKFAGLIPNAKLEWVEGMGHIISKPYTPNILGPLTEHLHEFNHPTSLEELVQNT
ncbi:MAG: alpha/beta hydrolase [Bacteroidota bacterium]